MACPHVSGLVTLHLQFISLTAQHNKVNIAFTPLAYSLID